MAGGESTCLLCFEMFTADVEITFGDNDKHVDEEVIEIRDIEEDEDDGD